jgi:hypothetical protein
MDPAVFRQVIGWATILSLVSGLLVGIASSSSRPPPGDVRNVRLSRWSLRIGLQAAVLAIVLGVGLAIAGAYLYGRPWPWSVPSFEGGSHDLADALGAMIGVVTAGGGAFLLAENVVARRRRRSPRGSAGSTAQLGGGGPSDLGE